MKKFSQKLSALVKKKYSTETELSDTTDSQPKKQKFSVKNAMYNMEVKRLKELKIIAFKLLTVCLTVLLTFMGHFYCAIAILCSASMLHIEVISLGGVVKKDNQI